MNSIKDERDNLSRAIAALEGQRSVLGDAVVETALAPLYEKLAALQSNPTTEQRKLVTVLFADLVGFTTMAEQMDPEDVREIMNSYFTRWTAAIEHFGGIVEKFIGDAVMAVFGLKTAGEADPENAIRAALQMRDLLKRLQHDDPDDKQLAQLRMRVGIHTGPVVVSWMGERKGQEFIVVGDSVNLASRLQSLAPVNGVLISHDTYRHVRDVFDVQVVEPVLVKGKTDPIQAYVVLQEKEHAFREPARGVEEVATTLIGRQIELDRLQVLLQEVIDQQECRVVTILGEAGLGKTRLLLEFDDRLELQADYYIFKGRASPVTQNQPYGLLHAMFAHKFAIHDSDPPPVVRATLEKAIGVTLMNRLPVDLPDKLVDMTPVESGEQRQAQMKTHFIARLLGFEIGLSKFLPEADPLQILERGLVYIGEYFQALAEKNPVVILFEDLHWADDNTLDLLRRLVRVLMNTPLLILSTARPILLDRQPEWGEGMGFATRLDLEPLSQADSKRLVQEILHKAPNLPYELTELVVRNAEGVPFYVEELIKMLIDDGVIDTQSVVWRVDTTRLANLRVPSTLTEVLQARFDSLSANEKVVLQRAAVVGRTFWDQALSYVGSEHGSELPVDINQQSFPVIPSDGSAILAQLQRRELIFQRDHSTLEKAKEFFFKHNLLRDVTYESLLKRYRRIYHTYTAQWLESVVGQSQRADEYASMIAEHYDLAGGSGSLLLAAGWYVRAARSAEERYANQSALRFYQRALELMPETHIEQRSGICLGLVELYSLLGDRAHQLEMLQSIDALLARLADPVVAARLTAETKIRWAAYYNQTGDYQQAAFSASQAVGLAKTTGDALIEIRGRNSWATACRYQSDFSTARDLYLSAKSLAEKLDGSAAGAAKSKSTGDFSSMLVERRRPTVSLLLADAYQGLGVVCEIQAEYGQARQYLEQALILYRKINYLMGESRALNSLGVVTTNQFDLESSQNYLAQALQIKHLIGDRYGEGVTLLNLGVVSERAHKLETAIKYFQRSLEICREIEDEEGVEAALIGIGNNYHALGDYSHAREILEQALAISRKIGDRHGELSILNSLGELFNELGQPGSGNEFCRQSIRICDEIGARSEAGYAWFFLGRSLELLGLVGEARQAYQHSLEIRRELRQANLMVDSQAGLARTHLTLGDRRQAMELSRSVIETIQSGALSDLSQPVEACLACYWILLPDQPDLARKILLYGHEFILKVAGEVQDEGLRKSFLERVTENIELLALI